MKSYFNRFDRLTKLVMEDINSSKVSRRRHIVSEGKCSELRKLHCITVGQAKAQLAELDPNTELYVHSIDEKGETWDDCVVMGFEDWSDDYAVIDRDMFDRKPMTAGELLNNLQDIPDNRFFASLAYATYAHKPDYVKEIQRDGTIIVDMAWFPYNGEEGAPCRLDVQSVKVDKSKKVIKESARRHARRHLIKEDRLTQDQWLDMLQEKFDGVVKGICEKYPNELINSINTENFSSDPEDNACQILDGLFVDLIDRFPQNLLTERDKKWISKYSDQWEGCEGLWSDYCWGGHDVGAYKCLREKFPILADFVDKYVKEHPYEGSNAKYHYTDPRAKNPPFPTEAPVAESVKKPVSKKRVIKEHRVHRPSRRRVIKEDTNFWSKPENKDWLKETIGIEIDELNKEKLGKDYEKYDPNNDEVALTGIDLYTDDLAKALTEKGIFSTGREAELFISDYLHINTESVKKPVSKRRLIKEHRAHRPSRRRQVIKESAKRPVRRHIRRQIKK